MVVAWHWDFGDGSTSTEETPVHTFSDAGTHLVSLTVTADDGATDVGRATVVVGSGPDETSGVLREASRPGLMPRQFELAGSAPNPFRGATTLRFALPERANVKLSVYDVTGRLVQDLVDETREAGRYDLKWDAKRLASGAYFVKLTANAFTETRRVLLLK
jgi:hypothetical protein